MDDLVKKILEGDKRATARAITLVENESEEGYRILKKINKKAGNACVIGITGSGGVGKSSLINSLIGEVRQKEEKVGVLAIDPTSSSGGAFLGDRIRMQQYALNEGVFLRSLASRGKLGGLTKNIYGSLKVLTAAGYKKIIIETVGVGQGELDISKIADITLLILSPNSGDETQIMKGGIMEAADIFVVNKADIQGAEKTAAHIESFFGLDKVLVYKTNALSSEGVTELYSWIIGRLKFLEEKGLLEKKGKVRLKNELLNLINNKVYDAIEKKVEASIDCYVEDIYKKRRNIYRVADKIIKELT